MSRSEARRRASLPSRAGETPPVEVGVEAEAEVSDASKGATLLKK
jgi:hypothetical protein